MPARPATALVATSLAATVVVIVIACASSSTPKSTAGIDQLPLAPGRDPGHFVYREPNLDPSQYKALLIDDTVVFSGPGTDFGKTSPQDQQRLAMLLTKSLNDELRKRNYHLATGPGPGVARLHTSLIGITESKPAAATLARLSPVGLGLSAIKSAEGKPAAFTGSITISGEITDSVSGEALGAFVAAESPLALDLTSAGRFQLRRQFVPSSATNGRWIVDHSAPCSGRRLQERGELVRLSALRPNALAAPIGA